MSDTTQSQGAEQAGSSEVTMDALMNKLNSMEIELTTVKEEVKTVKEGLDGMAKKVEQRFEDVEDQVRWSRNRSAYTAPEIREPTKKSPAKAFHDRIEEWENASYMDQDW